MSLRAAVVEWLLVREAERTARGYTAERRAFARAGRRHWLAAREISRPAQVGSALVLYREALLSCARWLRAGAAVAILAVLAYVVVGYATAEKNVLRGKPVTSSGTALGAPENMVNGAIEWGTYGWMSESGSPAWILVDLEGSCRIDRVRIFNRGDTRFERQLPLRVELLDERKAVRDAADCTEQFSQVAPCVLSMRGSVARYLRASHPGQMVLSEIEAYGRP